VVGDGDVGRTTECYSSVGFDRDSSIKFKVRCCRRHGRRLQREATRTRFRQIAPWGRPACHCRPGRPESEPGWRSAAH